ncbi:MULTISPECIES: hypothetical protein [unclassified Polaromonas]|uniref:hypothetical protein n=1 Tax=unclassified Polaromonas TaxID=2638319 RepID=UPI0018C957C8|nr:MULTISPECIES: hypothetical protein [unclassified Polaromonas]MBG6073836.1 putative nucleic acid-binding protein [Polaromonas sp. CG_9.7]MBG6115862.1 putative nucleic acid-binding protein [Polaromonas sp. CG_9.2]
MRLMYALSALEQAGDLVGIVKVAMSLADEVAAVRALFERYDNVPASLADAYLVRMSELDDPCRVITLDSNFHTYRSHGAKVIPALTPRPCDGQLGHSRHLPVNRG